MGYRAWPEVRQAEKRRVRGLADFPDRFHACGIERVTYPGRKLHVLDQRIVRKLWRCIEHWFGGCLSQARLAQAFPICVERFLSPLVVVHGLRSFRFPPCIRAGD